MCFSLETDYILQTVPETSAALLGTALVRDAFATNIVLLTSVLFIIAQFRLMSDLAEEMLIPRHNINVLDNVNALGSGGFGYVTRGQLKTQTEQSM